MANLDYSQIIAALQAKADAAGNPSSFNGLATGYDLPEFGLSNVTPTYASKINGSTGQAITNFQNDNAPSYDTPIIGQGINGFSTGFSGLDPQTNQYAYSYDGKDGAVNQKQMDYTNSALDNFMGVAVPAGLALMVGGAAYGAYGGAGSLGAAGEGAAAGAGAASEAAPAFVGGAPASSYFPAWSQAAGNYSLGSGMSAAGAADMPGLLGTTAIGDGLSAGAWAGGGSGMGAMLGANGASSLSLADALKLGKSLLPSGAAPTGAGTATGASQAGSGNPFNQAQTSQGAGLMPKFSSAAPQQAGYYDEIGNSQNVMKLAQALRAPYGS